VLSLLTAVALFLVGTSPVAVIGYTVVSLAGYVALYEVYRAARARVRSRSENPLQATLALFTRNRRRYGGYIVHLGITIIGIGVIGSTVYQHRTEQNVAVGDVIQVNDTYQLRYDNFTSAVAEDGRLMDIADVTVIRDGREIANLRPRIDQFPDMPMTIAGAHSTLENDFYVLLVGGQETNFQRATFRIYVNPLVNLIWWGGLVLILGTFISAWPNETMPVRAESRRPEKVKRNPLGAPA
jgi:cytochrome c-type biogenesis protein CcmF